MTTETRPTLRCDHCRCLITQDEADQSSRIFETQGTLCPTCAAALVGGECCNDSEDNRRRVPAEGCFDPQDDWERGHR